MSDSKLIEVNGKLWIDFTVVWIRPTILAESVSLLSQQEENRQSLVFPHLIHGVMWGVITFLRRQLAELAV